MGGSILVVEADAATRELLAANLSNAGYRVSCAADTCVRMRAAPCGTTG